MSGQITVLELLQLLDASSRRLMFVYSVAYLRSACSLKYLETFFFTTSLRFVAVLCCSVIVNLNLTFNKLWNKHYNVRIYISSSLLSSSCILLGICWYNGDNKLVLNRNQLWCQRDSYFQFRTKHPVEILKILDLVALKYFYDIRYLISMPIKL